MTATVLQIMQNALTEQKPLTVDGVKAKIARQIGQLAPLEEEGTICSSSWRKR